MDVAFVPGNPGLFDVVLALILLVGVPAVILVVLATLPVYISQDAKEFLEELEAETPAGSEDDSERLSEDDER